MKKNIAGIMAIALFAAFTSCDTKKADDSKDVAEEQNENNLEDSDLKKDSEFAVEAADGGLFEVQAGTLASNKATSPEVKKFGEMMVKDHGAANEELKSLAAQKNIVLPDVMSEDLQKKYYDLDQKQKGDEFDKEYIDAMVDDHKEDINKFEKQAENGNDQELKTWASSKLQTLRQHLQEAERIQESLKNKNRK